MKPQVHFLPSVDSTNDYLKNLIQEKKARPWDLVWADYQAAGKGQRGHTWDSISGENLLFSTWVEAGKLPVSEVFSLNQRAALAVHSLLQSRGVEEVKVKWPNDILVAGKKIAGILIENNLEGARIDHSVIGIGLNVNQSAARQVHPHAISLLDITGKSADRKKILLQLHQKLQEFFSAALWPAEKIHDEYLKQLFGYHQWLTYRFGGDPFSGRITGISSTGKLQMNTETGRREFDLREIEFVYS